MKPALRALALLSLAAACTKPPAEQPPPATDACTEAAPCALTPGTAVKNRIAAKGEVDHFVLKVPANAAPRTILHLELASLATVTPVKLVGLVEAPGGASVLGTAGPAASVGNQHLAMDLLLPGPGDFPILVRDVASTASDPHNEYSLTATLLADPDAGEPDDTPAKARPLALGAAETKVDGFLAFRGDRDLVAFEVAGTGTLATMHLTQAATGGALRMRARVLLRSTTAPDDLGSATAVTETVAARAGAGVETTFTRYYAPGKYLVELTDQSGQESDARAEAKWTLSLATAADPDPIEATSRNDTAASATLLAPGASPVQGAIGSEGDRDWYRVSVPAGAAAQLLEVKLDPQGVNNDLALLWAVGVKRAQPSGACDASCGPAPFCDGGKCAYDVRALRAYAANDDRAQVVRIPLRREAAEVFVLVSAQGDAARSAQPYAVSATVFDEQDAHELSAPNDTRAVATPVAPVVETGGVIRYSVSGRISWWDYVDGKATFQQRADGDWFRLDLPPADPAPECPATSADAGCTDLDAGIVATVPRPRYGLTMNWKGPEDATYRIGLQGVVAIDGVKTACRFSFDEKYAHAQADGRYSLGDQPTDPCFCLPAAQAEQGKIWVKVEAAHRPAPPEANSYTDQPWDFELVLTPDALQATCQAKCDAVKQPSTCPGE